MDACLQDPKQADTLVSAACAQGKADGTFGWLPRGERCWFNFECVGEYVCRPTKLHIDVLGDHFCLEQGDEGKFCDSDGDCQASLKCLDEHLYENGQCGFPN